MADEGSPDFEVLVGLFQDLEDLKAQVQGLTAQVKTLTERHGPGEASGA